MTIPTDARRTVTCELHGLQFDPSVANGCVVCRRSAPPAAPTASGSQTKLRVAAAIGFVVIVAAVVVYVAFGDAIRGKPADPSGAIRGTLTTSHAGGRTGAYLLPPQYEGQARPLLVLLHGTGADGAAMVDAFRTQAIAERLLVVAPDSGPTPSGEFSWAVGDRPGDDSDDAKHVRACVAEFRAMPGVVVDDARVLIAGFSGGGSSAPYIASNWPDYKAFAVLHGGVMRGGIGINRVRGWFSTGQGDTLRPPQRVEGDLAYLRDHERFADLTYRVFPGGHAIYPEESRAVIVWWLGL